MVTLDECIQGITPEQSTIVYFTKKNGNIVALRKQDVSDHSHTTMTLFVTGEVLEQYHGQARHNGELKVRDAGARYFVAYWRNKYTNKIEIRNFGRV